MQGRKTLKRKVWAPGESYTGWDFREIVFWTNLSGKEGGLFMTLRQGILAT